MNPKNMNPEYLSQDILEDVFVNSFKLVFQVQMYMGTCRVNLKDRFITSPSRWQKLYTACVLLICIILVILVVMTYFVDFHTNYILYILIITATGIHVSMCYLNMIHVRFFNGSQNAEFYLSMQRIDRLMHIDHNVYMNAIPRRVNMISVVIILTTISLILLMACLNNGTVAVFGFMGIALSQGTFIMELTFCSNIVVYFFLRLSFVNSIIYNHLQHHKHDTEVPNLKFPTKKVLRNLAALTHNFTTCKTDIFLKEIFESFFKFQNIYRFQVLLFFTRIVLLSICSFEIIIIGLQNGIFGVVDIAAICIFIVIDILILIFLCIRLEMFFGRVKETKRLSISVMSLYQEGELRDKARAMYKIVEDTPPRFSVYDMWQVEARVLLQLFTLMTTIMVTLIQFALL